MARTNKQQNAGVHHPSHLSGYSASRYEFVLGVRIRTGYAGDCSLLPQPINVIHGKVRLQMVLRTLGILIFIMIPSSGDDIIVSAAAVGLINQLLCVVMSVFAR
jgi:hypothetical protein